MPLSALAMVLVAALLHALWNIVAKRAGGDRHFVMLGALLIVVVWAPVGLTLGWQQVPRWGLLEWAFIVGSGLTHLVYFNVLLKGYRVSDLTVVYPVARGTGPLVSSMVSVVVFGEVLGWHGVAGVLGVCGGVFLVAGGPGLWRAAHEPERRARVRAGIAWGAATGLLIAGYTVLDGYAVKRLALSPILVDYFGNVVRVPFMLPATLRRRDEFADACRRLWKPALAMAIVSPFAYILVLYAARMAPLSHVAPAREVSMLFAALVGGRLLGEGDRGWRAWGAALMAGGVILLAWGG
jgi:drug/metabolite transporter (DMT)-like permease